jgi:hypothetical protein
MRWGSVLIMILAAAIAFRGHTRGRDDSIAIDEDVDGTEERLDIDDRFTFEAAERFSGRASKRDGIRPRTFIVDLARGPDDALRTAVIDIVTAGEQNLTLRVMKKALAVIAIVFLLAAAAVVAVARAKGIVVYS